MKQIYQNLRTGETILDNVPVPQCKKGCVIIKSNYSLISAGTERMLIDFGKSNYLQKAKKQPEKVKMLVDKIKTDGLVSGINAAFSKINQPLPMGYSNVGIVQEVGEGVTEFKIGDRVVSNGRHAEYVCVPKNLVTIIPKDVDDETAAFTIVSSIALQGVRITSPTIGECVVVIGLGLIGLITVQILKANGCRVLGFDYDNNKVELAKLYGAEAFTLVKGKNILKKTEIFSRGRGVDAVIITASTDSNEPIHNAALMCRKQGRITLVGVAGLNLQRGDFYEKEISFRVSCSYGPGRYDPFYEDLGNDYPIGYVRWTEKRNFEAVLDMFSEKSIKTEKLKSYSFNINAASQAYSTLLIDTKVLGILIKYNKEKCGNEKIITLNKLNVLSHDQKDKVVLGIIGSGNHSGRTLIPAFRKCQAILKTICSSQGMQSSYYGRKYKFLINTTDLKVIFNDPQINSIVIATQHDSHAKLTVEGLKNKKNIFVEKPLALNLKDLNSIESAYSSINKINITCRLMVGFNRRFAPLMIKLKNSIEINEPMSIIYTCNAGDVPSDSWIHNLEKGGGRLVGEACHFIDACRFLANSSIKSINSTAMTGDYKSNKNLDNFSITIKFQNGSIANIHYLANGHKSFPKERIEVFQGGGIAVLDNFLKLKSYKFNNLKSKYLFSQDKGFHNCTNAFINSIIKNEESPIPYHEIIEVSKFTIDAAKQILKF